MRVLYTRVQLRRYAHAARGCRVAMCRATTLRWTTSAQRNSCAR